MRAQRARRVRQRQFFSSEPSVEPSSRALTFSVPVTDPVFALRVFSTALALTFEEGLSPVVQAFSGALSANGTSVRGAFPAAGSFVLNGTYRSVCFDELMSRAGAVGASADYAFTVGLPAPVPEPAIVEGLLTGLGALVGSVFRRQRGRE